MLPAGKLLKAFKVEMASLSASGDESGRQELAALGLRMAGQLGLAESPTLLSTLIVNSEKRLFLGALDPDSEIVNTGRSAAEELAFRETEGANLRALVRKGEPAHAWMATAPAEVRGRFADLFALEGEVAASRYLVEAMDRAASQAAGGAR